MRLPESSTVAGDGTSGGLSPRGGAWPIRIEPLVRGRAMAVSLAVWCCNWLPVPSLPAGDGVAKFSLVLAAVERRPPHEDCGGSWSC